MDVAIFGAGIAGLMTAISLHADGHRCRIFERQAQVQEAGLGFILMPEGMDCLRRFQVPLESAHSGMPLHAYYHRDARGEILHEQAMPAGARGFRRRDLVAPLAAAIRGKAEMIFNAGLKHLEFDEATRRVTAAQLASGDRITAELYVGTDGVNSRARKALYPDWPTQPGRVMELVGLSRSSNAVKWAGNNFNKFHAVAGAIAFGVLPVNGDQIVWYLQFDAHTYTPPQEQADALRAFAQKLVGDWAAPVPELIATSDFSHVHLWRTVDADIIPRFHLSNLVLAGDAAHPLLPFTSRGVSSAMADAVELAKALAEEQSLPSALDRYSSVRQKECAPYVTGGRDLMQKFLAPQDAASAFLPIA